MLQHVSIRNVVLIEACDIDFAEGLNVLTGETGAGKSILLDSLGLALGARGDSKLVRSGEAQASVTAEFDISKNHRVQDIMDELGLEQEDAILIRRTVSAEGKSRCFINDQPVSVSGLKRIGEQLLEINGQHDQRGLLDTRSHLELLDAFGQLEDMRSEVEQHYAAWKSARRQLSDVKEALEAAEREQDYLQHIAGELAELNPQEGEEERLSDARTTMMQSEKMAEAITSVQEELSGQNSVEQALQRAQRIMDRSLLNAAEKFEPVMQALERAQVEVAEAESQLQSLSDANYYDAHELDTIEERLFALKGAARKHNVSVDELLALREEIEGKLAGVNNQQQEIAKLEVEVQRTRMDYVQAAEQLSQARGRAAEALQQRLHKELVPLKMQKTRFRVVQEELAEEHWGARGTDAVRFEAATNAGQPYGPLNRIASGGELSRFMLALKVALSSLKGQSSLIFDEIDTGTGGAVADAIGARLALLSEQTQVLVVTHLPQVAARGNHHLFIEKTETKGNTRTRVRALDMAERKEELARMLAGAEVTDEARGAADKLMQAAG